APNVVAGDYGKHKGQSPEEMAKKALNKWQKTLKITPEQAPQFEAAMTESYRKMAEAKTAAAGDKTKMKESMVTVLKEREESLAQVLTADQMKIYKEKIAKVSKKTKEHMAKTDDTK
ncbi:MAG TPA: hypothetical protein VFP10_08695, partial [Candidatus Eisenbacteria bacterium]|nr:hypothetical protein [Candidatus Eisenbacteria bacterium]